MTLKLFIDECLTPVLANLARLNGYPQSTCARDRGFLGKSDAQVLEYVLQHDFTLVTHNSIDFRGKGIDRPGGLHARTEVHCGLICLNSVHVMDFDRQQRLFAKALEELRLRTDLVNKALEIFELNHGGLEVQFYEIPPCQSAAGH